MRARTNISCTCVPHSEEPTHQLQTLDNNDTGDGGDDDDDDADDDDDDDVESGK